MICLECKHADLQAHPALSREGFVKCKAQPSILQFVSLTYNRHCKDYQVADDDILDSRHKWNENRVK